jgi:5,10-methenyltetrahydromethanopterin hydrogenase
MFCNYSKKIACKVKRSIYVYYSCTISNIRFEKVMIDLEATINVMSYFTYASLKHGPLNKTGVVI